jgi:hypothetical protein
MEERASQLSEPCRQLLQTALSMAQSPDGPGVCVKEIRQACDGVAPDALADCIVQKKSTFSTRCRSYLDSSPG